MIPGQCAAATGAADAVLRYNTAFDLNDADAALALWIQGREETVRAL